MSSKPFIIPVPSYLLDDAQLIEIHDRLQEMDQDQDFPASNDGRPAACIAAIRQELQYRNGTFTLNSDGTISHS
jgi:hypothetical protein